MKEFNLSEKAIKIDKNIMFFDTDIIKFIRRLKEKLFFEQNPENRNKIIDKLAGDKLVEGEK